MGIEPFIHWMKQIHGKISSAVYTPLLGQTNSLHLAFLRSLEKEIKAEQSLFTPLDELNFVVFDFETTGFFPEHGDQILSIGAVKLRGRTMKEEPAFYSLVQFNDNLTLEVKQLTGLDESDLKEALKLPEVLVQFYEFVKGDILVAHHASHEKKFLQQANWKLFKTGLKHRIIDTSFVFSIVDPKQNLTRLEDYCSYCGIDIQNRHHALGDARMTAQLWRIYLKKLDDAGCKTLSDIYERLAKLS